MDDKKKDTPHRSRTFPMGEPKEFSQARKPPKIEPMQPLSQPKRWLRMLATLGAPGLVLMAGMATVEVFAPEDWKPSVMVGEAIAKYEVTVIRETLMDRAEAEEKIAEARADGERQAEIAFQAELKELEYTYQVKLAHANAQFQTGMDAYRSLYERANQIQQATLQMEATVLQYRQQQVAGTQAGKSFVANAADIGCVFVPEMCAVSDEIRDDIANELVRAGRHGAGSIAQSYLRDMPTAAELQTRILSADRQPSQ